MVGILNKKNDLYIVYFYDGKYSHWLDTFFHSAIILKKIYFSFIFRWYVGKYSFRLDAFFLLSVHFEEQLFFIHFPLLCW